MQLEVYIGNWKLRGVASLTKSIFVFVDLEFHLIYFLDVVDWRRGN